MNSDQSRQEIGRRLAGVRRRIRRAQLLRGGLLVATVALGGLLVMMAADHFMAPLPGAARWAMFTAWVLGVGAALFAGIKPVTRKIGLVQVARWIEGRHPEIEERMSTILEIRDANSGASAGLLDELARAAGADIEQVDARTEIKAAGAGRRWARPAMALAALLLALFVIWPGEAARLAVRAVAPFSDLGNAAAVRFTVMPGDVELLEGDGVSIEVAYEGREQDLELVMDFDDGSQVTQPLLKSGEAWSYRMDPVRQGFRYRARAGRGESDAFRVTSWPMPAVVDPRVELTLPEYTGQPKQERALGRGVEAIRGTKVTLSGKLNTAIEAAWIEVGGKRLADGNVERSAGGGRVSLGWTMEAGESGEAVVWLKHRLGREVDALRFPYRVLDDLPPLVRWLKPVAKELRVRPDEVLALSYEVTEDHGVAALQIEVKTGGKQPFRLGRDLPEKVAGSATPARYRGNTEVALGELLEELPGAWEIRMRVRAEDGRPADLDGPGVGHSEWLLVRIDKNAESLARQELRVEHEEARETIEAAIRATREARERMDWHRGEMRNEALSKDAEKHFAEAREKLADAEADLKELAGRMEESVHASKAEQVRQASEEVAKAREDLESAPLQDDQEQREGKLDQARNEAEAAVKGLEEVRNQMDREKQRIEELARFLELAQQQTELARQADQMAEASPDEAVPQDWKDLQKAMEEALRQQLREQPQARAEALEAQAEEARELAAEARQLSEEQQRLAEQAKAMPVNAAEPPPAADGLREALAQEQQRIAEATAGQLAEARQERSKAADLLPQAVAETGEASEALSRGDDQAAAKSAKEAVQALRDAVADSPEQGSPEQGSTEQGSTEQGSTEQGSPEQGSPEQGGPEQGSPEQGSPEQGSPEQGSPEQGSPEQGIQSAAQAGMEHPSDDVEESRKAQVEALARRQEQVAGALEALAQGKNQEALQALESMQAEQAAALAEAVAGLPQVEGSGAMNEARDSSSQGSQQAQAAAEQGSQGKSQEAAGQHQQAAGSLQRSADALNRAADEFQRGAEQARGQQADPNRAPVSPADLAEAFQAASRASRQAQAAQAAGQASQAAEAMSRAAQAARQSMQGQSKPGQPGPPGPPGGPPGQRPDEGPRQREADPGVPPELAKLGISAADWEKIQATLKSDVGAAAGAGVPEEYRGLVRDYFDAMTKE
ncbi:DUF4175 family protein [Luteolibacter marinus]|uniref:DUF4175 family protein n=1 Tax=Luteolibacter marinus TaxID=2776705 RepID=UPI001868743B|nr:DUF4175 family protein [Luteolibacter marinus]